MNIRKFCILILILSNTACVSSKFYQNNTNRNIESIGIDCNFYQCDNIFKDSINTVINDLIYEFNKEKHNFTLHQKQLNDSFYVSINIVHSKLVSDDKVALSYVINGLGLIATPYLTFTGSNQKWLLFFWHLPQDYIEYLFQPSHLIYYADRFNGYKKVASDILLKSKKRRAISLQESFKANIKRNLEIIEHSNKK